MISSKLISGLNVRIDVFVNEKSSFQFIAMGKPLHLFSGVARVSAVPLEIIFCILMPIISDDCSLNLFSTLKE